MAINRHRRLFVSAVGAFILSFGAPVWAQGFPGGHRDALGPLYEAAPRAIPSPKAHPRARMDAVHHWNGIAIDASGLDHTPLAPDEARIFGEQYGPTRASRAMAIVHIAIFEAVKAVAEHKPDLLFLDVQMPKLTGFDVLELIGTDTPVIFVTAYDEFAMKAFDVHAVDYLLKPVGKERFEAALERAKERIITSRSPPNCTSNPA